MDEQLALALGWHKSADGTWWDVPGADYYVDTERPGAWHPTESLDDCAVAEAEIARRPGADGLISLTAPYVAALANGLSIDMENAARNVWYVGASDLFALITAPPEARVRAMLAVLGKG